MNLAEAREMVPGPISAGQPGAARLMVASASYVFIPYLGRYSAMAW